MKTREHLLREADGNKIHISSHYYSSGLTLGLWHSVLFSSASSLCSFLTWNIWRSLRRPRKFLLRKSKKQIPAEFSNVNKLVLFVWVGFIFFFPRNMKTTRQIPELLPFITPCVQHSAELLSRAIFIPAMPPHSAVISPSPSPWTFLHGFSPESFSWNNHCCTSHGTAPLGVCLYIFTAAQWQKTRLILLRLSPQVVMAEGAQGRGLVDPVNPVGAESTFIPVINEDTT